MPELVSGVSGRFYEEIEGYENPVSWLSLGRRIGGLLGGRFRNFQGGVGSTKSIFFYCFDLRGLYV